MDVIESIIAKEFEAKVISSEKCIDGFSHENYFVKLDAEPFEVVARISGLRNEKHDLAKEAYVMGLLRRGEIPVPKIFAKGKVGDKEYMVLEKFVDERLDLIWNSLSNYEKKDIAIRMGKVLKSIHHVKFDSFGYIREGGVVEGDKKFKFNESGISAGYNVFLMFYFSDILQTVGKLAAYDPVSDEYIAKVLDFLLKGKKDLVYDGSPVLVHGDFHKDHIFVKKEKEGYVITGLIDFEFALSSSPDFDFIKLARQGFLEDDELKEGLVEGYGVINEKAVKIFRITRDLAYAMILLGSSAKEKADKVLSNIEKLIEDY